MVIPSNPLGTCVYKFRYVIKCYYYYCGLLLCLLEEFFIYTPYIDSVLNLFVTYGQKISSRSKSIVIVELQAPLWAKYVGTFIIYLDTKFRILR